jgi:hypothetical protein
MLIQENGPELDNGSGPLNTSLSEASNASNIKQKPEVSQAVNLPLPGQFGPQAFPTFFELVTENAAAPMRRAACYLRVCDEFSSLGDLEAFCDAGDKFLDAGREIAKLLSLLKKPTTFSNERADRLEEKARELHNLADLTEMEASRIRSVVTL